MNSNASIPSVLLLITVVVLNLLMGGCEKQNDPESVLRDYVDYRFMGGQDRGELLKRTTGNMYQKIEQMSNEDFNKFKSVDKLGWKKLSINNKACTDIQCEITYSFSYDMQKNDEKSSTVDVKTIATLEKVSDEWKIADIRNVKTFIDAKESIDIGP